MPLSNGGKVVVIDNELEKEALPLMVSLGKKGIPYLYFSGDKNYLPVNPLVGIRFVFLDIELFPGIMGKNIASACANVLKTIISIDNGPYVIIFWSKHTEHILDILSYCEKVDISPVAYLDLEKSDCFTQKKIDPIDYITEKIEYKLENLGALNFFIEWENIIHKSINTFVYSISKIEDSNKSESGDTKTFKPLLDIDCEESTTSPKIAIDVNWDERLILMFSKLFISYSEEGDDFTNKEKMSSVYQMINSSFIDTIQLNCDKAESSIEFFNRYNIKKDFFERICCKVTSLDKYDSSSMKDINNFFVETEGFYKKIDDISKNNLNKINASLNHIVNSVIGFNSIAKLNSALFLNFTKNQTITTGNIYSIKEISIKESLCLSMGFDHDKCKIVSILLTPSCDIAQKKAIAHRLVYGIISNEKCTKDSESLFKIGPYWDSNNPGIKYLIINLQTIHMLTIEQHKKLKIDFTIKRDLLFDLQSKAASHVNRLGNFQMSV